MVMDFLASLTALDIAGHLAVLTMCLATLIAITAGYLPPQFIFMIALGGPMLAVAFESLAGFSLSGATIAAMIVFAALEALWIAGNWDDKQPQETAGHEDWKP